MLKLLAAEVMEKSRKVVEPGMMGLPDEEPFVEVQRVPCLLLVHLEILLQEVDNTIVVAGKKPRKTRLGNGMF